ncbi:MAG TPA: 4-hydroxy-tetrahydrodipicolinate reductase [Ignavibacteria bacterium]|nr:4-hydroxy-tetrahydrodipicolinate reductase [Ignavibacteria bacterium]
MKKISLIGYGKMGKTIERLSNNHNVLVNNIIRNSDSIVENETDLCIDFTTPKAFIQNYKMISKNFKYIIIGTTGWENSKNEIFKYFVKNGNNVIYGSNFSIGVNILFLLSDYASKCFAKFPEYSVSISEKHHSEKKDRPSGTAISLQEIISHNKKVDDISSIRSGKTKGIHEIDFTSETDSVKLEHQAYSRDGFAIGALMAVNWISEVNGIIEFRELIKNKILNYEK